MGNISSVASKINELPPLRQESWRGSPPVSTLLARQRQQADVRSRFRETLRAAKESTHRRTFTKVIYDRGRRSVVSSARPKATRRATIRPRSSGGLRRAKSSRPSAGDGPPPAEPPRARAGQLRTLTRKIRIQHAKVGRRIPVRADVFLAALGLGGATPTAKPEPVRSDWRGRALRLIGGGR
jgi:hypothetical protein